MRVRRLVVVTTLTTSFVGVVVQAAAVNQCPASALGACARLHLAMMRSRPTAPLALAAAPMRGESRRS